MHHVREREALRVKMIVSIGTIVMPPPMPSSPARKPTNAPRATNAGDELRIQRRVGALRFASLTMNAHSPGRPA